MQIIRRAKQREKSTIRSAQANAFMREERREEGEERREKREGIKEAKSANLGLYRHCSITWSFTDSSSEALQRAKGILGGYESGNVRTLAALLCMSLQTFCV